MRLLGLLDLLLRQPERHAITFARCIINYLAQLLLACYDITKTLSLNAYSARCWINQRVFCRELKALRHLLSLLLALVSDWITRIMTWWESCIQFGTLCLFVSVLCPRFSSLAYIIQIFSQARSRQIIFQLWSVCPISFSPGKRQHSSCGSVSWRYMAISIVFSRIILLKEGH